MQKDTKERPLYFYVANLGSEVQRIFSWKEKGDKEAMENAYQRAITIVDTIEKFNNASANKEMSIFKSILNSVVSGSLEFNLDRDQVSAYFNPFALRVINRLHLT